MGLLTAEQYAQPNRFTSGMDTAPTGAVNNPYLQDYLANYQGWQNNFALPPSTFDRYSFTEAEADPAQGLLGIQGGYTGNEDVYGQRGGDNGRGDASSDGYSGMGAPTGAAGSHFGVGKPGTSPDFGFDGFGGISMSDVPGMMAQGLLGLSPLGPMMALGKAAGYGLDALGMGPNVGVQAALDRAFRNNPRPSIDAIGAVADMARAQQDRDAVGLAGPVGSVPGSNSQGSGEQGFGGYSGGGLNGIGADREGFGADHGDGSGGGDGDGGGGECFAKGTMIEMSDGDDMAIEDIQINDETAGGRVRTIMQWDASRETWFDYEGVEVTGDHAVLEDGVWKRVENANKAKQIDGYDISYTLNTTDHRIVSNGVVFADYIEHDHDHEIHDGLYEASLNALNDGEQHEAAA